MQRLAALERLARPLESLLWVGVLVFVGYRFAPQAAAALGIGRASAEVAPALTFQTLGGEALSLASPRGKVVLVDFWATWWIS